MVAKSCGLNCTLIGLDEAPVEFVMSCAEARSADMHEMKHKTTATKTCRARCRLAFGLIMSVVFGRKARHRKNLILSFKLMLHIRYKGINDVRFSLYRAGLAESRNATACRLGSTDTRSNSADAKSKIRRYQPNRQPAEEPQTQPRTRTSLNVTITWPPDVGRPKLSSG